MQGCKGNIYYRYGAKRYKHHQLKRDSGGLDVIINGTVTTDPSAGHEYR
jgi:hypothetical protein